MELSAWFENLLFGGGKAVTAAPRVVTVIGSGGKTSLIWRLAADLASKRGILVTPTTKMLVPSPEEKLYDRYCNANSFRDDITAGITGDPIMGITLAGVFNEAIGKLESLPLPALSQLAANRRGGAYDLVLIEGDGSKGLPLKAWAAHEPVVPDFTALTIGVLPLWPIGKPVSESLIHRLPLFLSLTGAAAGVTLKPEHIIALITRGEDKSESSSPGGLFARARGKKLLFFNQVEDDEALRQAWEIAALLAPNDFHAVIAGSARLNQVYQIRKFFSRRRSIASVKK